MVYFLITCHFAEILKFGVRWFVPEAIDIPLEYVSHSTIFWCVRVKRQHKVAGNKILRDSTYKQFATWQMGYKMKLNWIGLFEFNWLVLAVHWIDFVLIVDKNTWNYTRNNNMLFISITAENQS